MARIAIYQVDGTNYQGVQFPNISLMKISAFHKSIGDTVEWYDGLLMASQYDKIYASKIFNFSEMPQVPANMIIGGTGIDFYNRLPEEIEAAQMDWSIYPDTPFHYGFSMKGCRFACKFCCVPKKEGKPKTYNTIDELLTNPKGKNKLMLLDNDFFGGADWKQNLLRIIELKLKVCFVQGLNIRIITEEQAELLAKCDYRNSKFNKKYLTFAWDRFNDGKVVKKGIDICNRAGIPSSNMQFFVLIGFDTTPEQDLERVMFLKDIGAMPFVMPHNKSDKYQKAFARWVNSRWVFKSCSWQEYDYNPANIKSLNHLRREEKNILIKKDDNAQTSLWNTAIA